MVIYHCGFVLHVTTLDRRFIFYVNEHDVSTVSTRQVFCTNELISKQSTGSISNSRGTFGTIHGCTFGLYVWIVKFWIIIYIVHSA